MKSLDQLQSELEQSLSHAQSLYDSNTSAAIKKHEELMAYYSSLKAQMISAAEKRFKEAKEKLDARPKKLALTPGKRGRPSKLEKEIEQAKRKQKEMLATTLPPLTRQQIQEGEEKKKEEVRAANISTVFNMFGFDEEEMEADSDSDESFTEEEIREAAERMKALAKQKKPETEVDPTKQIILDSTIPLTFSQTEPKYLAAGGAAPFEPEITEEERQELRREAMAEDRKYLAANTAAKKTVVSIAHVQNLVINQPPLTPSTPAVHPPAPLKKAKKSIPKRETSIGAVKTYKAPTSCLHASSPRDEEGESDGTQEP